MKSTPLLMKCPLVRATLAGVKTETRRLITSLNGIGKISHLRSIDPGGYEWAYRNTWGVPCQLPVMPLYDSCPYGGPGDRLRIRETFRTEQLASGLCGYRFKADGAFVPIADTEQAMQAWVEAHAGQRGDLWRPAIFMPREVCRIAPEILNRSIEHIQDITDEAIRAEGVADMTFDELLEMGVSNKRSCGRLYWEYASPRERFELVWNLVYGADPSTSWSANPPVWVLKYRKVTT